MRWIDWLLRKALRGYQVILSPALHSWAGPWMGCRYEPTCSEYARQSVGAHGPLRGGWFALKRVLRCHPLSRSPWFDPVPLAHECDTPPKLRG